MFKFLKHHKYKILTIVSIALLVAGFIVPPTGIIDPSVLTAVGILNAMPVLHSLPEIIKEHTIRVTKDGIEVDND